MECEDQRLRKLHAVVETLVNHRKGNRLGTTCSVAGPCTVTDWGGGHQGAGVPGDASGKMGQRFPVSSSQRELNWRSSSPAHPGAGVMVHFS